MKPKLSNLKPLLTSTPSKNDLDKQKIFAVKNYIPPYLKKRIQHLSPREDQKISQNTLYKATFKKEKSNLTRLSTKAVTKVVSKFPDKLTENVTYLVYRNELETEKMAVNARSSVSPNEIKNNITSRRRHSPQSQDSSTCSSHNSISTVRAVSVRRTNFNQKKSTSDLSTSETFGTENKTTKTKKYFRKCKSNKKLNVIHGNVRDTLENNTSTGRNKNIYIAQMTSDNLTSLNTSKSRISKKFSLKNLHTKTDHDDTTATTSKMENTESDSDDLKKNSKLNLDNLVLLKYREKMVYNSNISHPHLNNVLCNAKEHTEKALKVVADIIEMIEARVNLLTESDYSNIDSENSAAAVDLVKLDTTDEIPNKLSSSNSSYDTSFDNDSHTTYNIPESTVTDDDLISFKSITSMTTSKLSEYFLANNQLTSNVQQQFCDLNQNSVRDIFDRKDLKTLNVSSPISLLISIYSNQIENRTESHFYLSIDDVHIIINAFEFIIFIYMYLHSYKIVSC